MHCAKWATVLLALFGAAILLNGCKEPAPETLCLVVQSEGSGSVVLDPPGSAHAPGTVVTLSAVAASGAHFDHWTGGLTGSANPVTVTLDADLSVTAVFAPNSYTLSYAAPFGGGISGATPQTVLYGGSGMPVTAVTGTGLHFVRWSDGSTDNPRTDANVTAALSVYAEFAVDTFTLAYAASAHGTVAGPAQQTVAYGTDGAEVTAVPDANCHFVQWSDGATTAARTDTNITADLGVTAVFALDTRTLNYAAGEHGTLAGLAQQTVDYGADGAEVTAVPDTGYHFTQWSDGVTTPARTDLAVTEDITITAGFAINVYTLAYAAGGHGTVIGATAQTVEHGGNGTAVTAVADEGCHFYEWSDHVATRTRIDANVTGDITVTAKFLVGVVIHVDADSTASEPDGIDWETAYREIQPAVDVAPAHAQVWVAEGTYTSTAPTVLNMRAAVLLYGGFAGTETHPHWRDLNAHKSVIDGENARMCVSGADYAALDGFTITRGYADNGGGMCNTQTSPVISHCVFAGNCATTNGGGLGIFGGAPLIEDCVFQGNICQGVGGGLSSTGAPVLKRCVFLRNTASSAMGLGAGGGIFCNSGSMALTDCYVAGNDGFFGGGLMALNSSMTVRGCVFSGNSATEYAGAIAGLNSTIAVDNCAFVRNAAPNGGALYAGNGSFALDNCVFRENSATEDGGAIYNESGSLKLRNCSFTRNSARYGGAIRPAHSEQLVNCILWGDTATSSGAEISIHDVNYIPLVTNSCIQGGFAGTGNIDADPLFVDAEGGSLYLQAGSPCLDTGTAVDAPATDMLGRSRPEGAGVDMGAYEGAATDLVTLTIEANPTHGGTVWPAAGSHPYVLGEKVMLAATPTGMRFTGWTGDVTDNAVMTSIEMDADKTVTAEFALNVIYVRAAGKGAEDGKSWATAFHDIQSAVDAAPADSTGEVWVAEGSYTATAEQVVKLKRGVLLYGGFAGDETSRDQRDWNAHPSVIDGEDTRRGVFGADNALMDGFTITRGYASLCGGGMYIDNTTPTVRNCVFVSNASSFGGGAMGINGPGIAPDIADCTFLENEATQNGGAIYNENASPRVRHCLFKGNTAGSGGATFEYGGYTQISDCTFVENSASVGGGIYSLSYGPSLARCAFVDNSATAGEGGGIFDDAGYGNGVVAENCLFLRNSALGYRGYGGAVRPADGPSTRLTNCTFTQNAALSGGAVGADDTISGNFSQPIITNCILWDNIGIWDSPEIYAGSTDGYYCVTYSCVKGGYMGQGNIDADPLFVDGPGGSVQLREGSPGLDSGAASSRTVLGQVVVAPNTDLLGRPRPAGAGIDMGAYEGAVSAADFVTLTIQTSPAEGGHTQPEAGTHTYARGETAWATALPLGMRFTGWTGDIAETVQHLELVMDADKTVTADFVPSIVYVNAAHSGPADGRSWATAFGTIQQAVDTAAADPGGEVWVAEGNYPAPGKTGLLLQPGVSVYGGFAGNESAREQRDWNAHPTIISRSGMSVGAVVGADDSVLDGFVVTQGQSGMFIRNCSPRVANCLFIDNSGTGGGGINNEGGSPTIVNCTFKRNRAGVFAGGMANLGGSPVLTGCLFVENSGVGLYNGRASVTVVNCTFEQNSAGGIQNEFYSPDNIVVIENCGFYRNSREGGMRNVSHWPGAGRLLATNCVFAGNSSIHGGGVESSGVAATFTNCTFTQNTATGYGTTAGYGGAYCQVDGVCSMTNCILWGNTAAESPEIFVGPAGTLTASHSCLLPGFGGEGCFYLDPLFVSPASGNVRLQDGSPCIDTGTAAGAPSTDITGRPRPQGAGFDMGACER